jgi:hypothetical protein
MTPQERMVYGPARSPRLGRSLGINLLPHPRGGVRSVIRGGGAMNTTITDRVILDAVEGRLSKLALADLLTTDKRQTFLDRCAAIEKHYTDECAASNDPCLESGCALEGEVCLQPLLRAETEYNKACGAVWIALQR